MTRLLGGILLTAGVVLCLVGLVVALGLKVLSGLVALFVGLLIMVTGNYLRN